MTTQTQTNSAKLRELALALPIAETIQADSRDYGFDFNEDELGRELLSPLPAGITVQSLPDANSAEKTFHYFLL